MTSDTSLAFAHPEERARADAPERDRIAVRELVLEADIGAFQAERGVTQRLRFDVVVEVTPLPADLADDVDKILSYDRITEAIEAALSEERLNLLETLAERVAEQLLWQPQAERVFVRIAKLDRGPGTLGVEIVRSHGSTDTRPSDLPHPTILSLGADEVMSPDLPRWLDQLSDTPLVICVGLPSIAVPEAEVAQAQRRIELLALEQQAWVLAGRDKRCVVVGTRTELDWGLRHGQISVWAPSKMVLDAVDGPTGAAGDIIAWFAAEMQASDVITLGIDVPTDLPLRTAL
ncbi:MAG: dihydroneopterin aldolase [Rhodobacteraceae bacterium]|nr:dihydroneopterin aldolase [Paracoccaceae bacterium]